MSEYLAHHGIKGQKWGVRRFQNADGTRTAAGSKRYGSSGGEKTKKGLSPTAKKAIIGGIAVAAVATAAVMYARHPQAVNNAVSKVVKGTSSTVSKAMKEGIAKKQAIKSTSDAVSERITKGIVAKRKEAAAKKAEYVAKNKEKILSNVKLANKYKVFLSDDEKASVIKTANLNNALREVRAKQIKRGSTYVNSIMSYANTASSIYNFSKSPLVKDTLNKLKQKKE